MYTMKFNPSGTTGIPQQGDLLMEFSRGLQELHGLEGS